MPRYKIKKNTREQRYSEAYDPKKHGISRSIIEAFLSCQQAADYRYRENLTPREEKFYFQEGTFLHSVDEKYYDQLIKKKPKSEDEAYQLCRSLLIKMEKAAIKQGALVTEKTNKLLLTAHQIMPSHKKYWFKKDKVVNWLGTEKDFRFPVLGGAYDFIGTYDRVYKAKSGRVGFYDGKYKQSWDANYLDGLELDLQAKTYALAIWKETGKVPSPAYFDLVRKPGWRIKKDETFTQFGERMAERVQEDQDKFFQRWKVIYQLQDMKNILQELEYYCEMFIDWFYRQKSMKNTTNCFGKYGTCSYIPICTHNDRTSFKTLT